MAASAIPAHPAPRIHSVDALRGAIMILMAIDHIRDYIARSAMQFLPSDLTRTTAAIFFTRWITHLCAPIFMLTAGLGAFLWMSRGHRSVYVHVQWRRGNHRVRAVEFGAGNDTGFEHDGGGDLYGGADGWGYEHRGCWLGRYHVDDQLGDRQQVEYVYAGG